MPKGRHPNQPLDVYARVSRLGDERQRSTEGQVADCIARIREQGREVGETHIDEGRSAWRPKVRRPAWDRLMARLESGATGGVVVFDLARFSRRPIEGERLIAAAERGLEVLDSEGEYDLTSASGKKAFRDQMAAGAYESDRLSTRVGRGKRLKAANLESNRSRRPYGYTLDWQIVPEEAAVVREIAARVLDAEPINALIRDLHTRGVTARDGGPWTNAGIRLLLLRPSIAGLASYKGDVVGEMKGVVPILARDDWDKIRAMFAARRRGKPPSPIYLASGIAQCEQCGFKLTGIPKPSYRPYPDGEVARHYYCHIRDGVHGGCGQTSVDLRATDGLLRALVVESLADPRAAEILAAAAAASTDRLQVLDEEIAECEALATELAGRLGRREITLARHDAAVGPLDRRLAQLREEREQAAASAPVVAAGAVRSRDEWRRLWDAGETYARRALLRQALRGRRLVVGPPVDGRLRSDPFGRLRVVD